MYVLSAFLYMYTNHILRWNSTHDMLIWLPQLRPAVHAVYRLEELLCSYALNDEDWNLLGRLQAILDYF